MAVTNVLVVAASPARQFRLSAPSVTAMRGRAVAERCAHLFRTSARHAVVVVCPAYAVHYVHPISNARSAVVVNSHAAVESSVLLIALAATDVAVAGLLARAVRHVHLHH